MIQGRKEELKMMSVTFLSGASLGGCARASGRGSEGEVVRR